MGFAGGGGGGGGGWKKGERRKCKCEDHTRVSIPHAHAHAQGRERGGGGACVTLRGVFVIVMRPPRYRIPRVRFGKISHGHPAHRRVCLRLRRGSSRGLGHAHSRGGAHRRVLLARALSPARVNTRSRSRGSRDVGTWESNGGRQPLRVREFAIEGRGGSGISHA